jgi:hypothetical protein
VDVLPALDVWHASIDQARGGGLLTALRHDRDQMRDELINVER